MIRLLVIDDDELDRRAVSRALQSAGLQAEICEVSSAAAALNAARERLFDCIILDHRLPATTGMELLGALRAAGNSAPVVVLTGMGDETVAVELMKAGVCDYLPKSALTPERLARSVTYAVGLGQAQRKVECAEMHWRRYVSRLGALALSAPEVYSSLNIDTLLEHTVRNACRIFEAPAALVVLQQGAEDQARIREARTEAPEQLFQVAPHTRLPWNDLWRMVCEKGRALRLPPMAELAGTKLEESGALCSKSWLLGPLRSRDGTDIGLLLVLGPPQQEFLEADEAILTQFTHTISVAVENAQLYQSARQATNARQEILAIVSHDLRVPLGSVQLGISLLREVIAPQPDTNEILRRLDSSVHHMRQLIDDLLDVARIDAGKLVVEPEPIALGALVELVHSMVAPLLQDTQVSLRTVLPPQLPTIMADRHRITQVLVNLLSNAAKFTPREGSITLEIVPQTTGVQFTIQDTGPGISPETLPLLFQRFWQGEQQRSRGVGLGLYIAKSVVEAHGGRIWAESSPGQGASFCFVLPVEPPKETSVLPESSAAN